MKNYFDQDYNKGIILQLIIIYCRKFIMISITIVHIITLIVGAIIIALVAFTNSFIITEIIIVIIDVIVCD